MIFNRKQFMDLLEELIEDNLLLGETEFRKGKIFAYDLILSNMRAYDVEERPPDATGIEVLFQ